MWRDPIQWVIIYQFNYRTNDLPPLPGVKRRTTRTNPSAPGKSLTTRPNFHCNGSDKLSLTTTMFLTHNPFDVSEVHLGRACSRLRYSLDQRRQNNCNSWCNIFHLDKRELGTLDMSRVETAHNDWPIRKCPGVRQSKSVGRTLAVSKAANLKPLQNELK